MTPNEKIILSLLKKNGGMPKPRIAEEGGMSWATAVKMTKRLEDEGYIRRGGTAVREEQKGKNAYLYELNPEYPLVAGIDIEYKTTRAIITNLPGEELHSVTLDTPRLDTYNRLGDFILEVAEELVPVNREQLAGVGVGMPWIGLPEKSKTHFIEKDKAESAISKALSLEANVENNTRTYAFYERWARRMLPDEDLIFISIRSGIGTGIFLKGELLSGDQGLAGEIGHLVVEPEGQPCRCGNRGCLETIVNQESLYRQYLERLAETQLAEANPHNIQEALKDLFSLAAKGVAPAVEIIDEAADQLSRGIAPLATTLNIRTGIISGHFGPAGSILTDKINEHLKKRIMPGLCFDLHYSDLDPAGHTHGAALLVLNQYLGW